MNTKKILLISSDKDLSGIVRISALTLTKLNCQVTIEESVDQNDARDKASSANLDMIIIDNDNGTGDTIDLLTDLRSTFNKKIILLHSIPVEREKIFEAGCDSIMTKDEFKRVINNILVF